jgi:hypothetical protein
MKSAVKFLLEKYKSQNTLLFADDWEKAKSIEEKILVSDEVIEEMAGNFSDKHFVYETAKDDVYFGFSEGMKSYRDLIREFLIVEEMPLPSHKFYLTTQDNIQDNISFLKSIEVFNNGQLFSVRIFNCLYGGFPKPMLRERTPKRNFYELVTSSEVELRQIRNFGTKCLFEIEQLLSSCKLKINMTDEEINSVDLSDMKKCAVK